MGVAARRARRYRRFGIIASRSYAGHPSGDPLPAGPRSLARFPSRPVPGHRAIAFPFDRPLSRYPLFQPACLRLAAMSLLTMVSRHSRLGPDVAGSTGCGRRGRCGCGSRLRGRPCSGPRGAGSRCPGGRVRPAAGPLPPPAGWQGRGGSPWPPPFPVAVGPRSGPGCAGRAGPRRGPRIGAMPGFRARVVLVHGLVAVVGAALEDLGLLDRRRGTWLLGASGRSASGHPWRRSSRCRRTGPASQPFRDGRARVGGGVHRRLSRDQARVVRPGTDPGAGAASWEQRIALPATVLRSRNATASDGPRVAKQAPAVRGPAAQRHSRRERGRECRGADPGTFPARSASGDRRARPRSVPQITARGRLAGCFWSVAAGLGPTGIVDLGEQDSQGAAGWGTVVCCSGLLKM